MSQIMLSVDGNIPAVTRLRGGVPIRSRQRGYILIALSLGAAFLLGMAGLAVDIGRMYVAKSETQSFVDSAAFSAALQLDGTQSGVTRALAKVASNPKKWQFQNDAFTGVQTSFATASNGPWIATPPNPPTGYYYTQVVATVNLPI